MLPTTTTLDWARYYVKKCHFSIIPLEKEGQEPPEWLPLEEYQNRRPEYEELEQWFGNGSQYNIGIVAGKISDITVVTIHSTEAIKFIFNCSFPETPVAVTPKGFDLYYRYCDSVKTTPLRDIDIVGEGDHIMAPLSIDASGEYSWANARGYCLSNRVIAKLTERPLQILLGDWIKKPTAPQDKSSYLDIKEADIITGNVNIDQIQRIDKFPNFTDPSRLPKPSLIKNNDDGQIFYVDGPEHIKKAQEENRESIDCVIHCFDALSYAELLMELVATRVKPQSGKPRFGELIKSVKFLVDFFVQNENYYLSGHGGNNKKKEEQIDIRELLESRLGINRHMVNDLISYGEHVTDSTLDRLIKENASAAFFSWVRSKKTKLVREMERKSASSDEKLDKKIEDEVSESVLAWFDEYENNKVKPKPKKKQKQPTATPAPQPSRKDEILNVINKLSEHIEKLKKFIENTDIAENNLKDYVNYVADISTETRKLDTIGKELAG